MDLLRPNTDDEWKLLLAMIAVVGGLVGSLVGFLSNQITTSRQIARQERDKRRDAYREFLGAITELKAAHARFVRLMRRAVPFRDGIESAGTPPTAVELSAAKEMAAEADEVQRLLLEKYARLAVIADELTLYAHRPLREAAARVARAAGHLVAASPSGRQGGSRASLDEAEKELSLARRDFMFLARADTRSAGSTPMWRAKRLMRGRWRSAEGRLRPILTAEETAELPTDWGVLSDGGPDTTSVVGSGPPE